MTYEHEFASSDFVNSLGCSHKKPLSSDLGKNGGGNFSASTTCYFSKLDLTLVHISLELLKFHFTSCLIGGLDEKLTDEQI
jgi:hypothetical protein